MAAKQILIIEDDPITIQIFSQILEEAGYRVADACDGYDGLDKVKKLKPALIICDVIMPRMDGFTFCREIIANNPRIPVFMVSSELRLRDVFLSIGARGFFTKPLKGEVIIKDVRDAIGPAESPRTKKDGHPAATQEESASPPKWKSVPVEPAEPVSPPAAEGPVIMDGDIRLTDELRGHGERILIAQDEENVALILQKKLKEAGYQVEAAQDGLEALQKVNARIPDVIVSDILMPKMDGFTFIKKVKNKKEAARVPIIVLTAKSSMEDSFRVIGVEHFLRRPYSLKELLTLLATLVRWKPAKPPEAEEEPAPGPEQEARPQARPEPGRPEEVPADTKRVFLTGSNTEILDNIQSQLTSANCHVLAGSYNKQVPFLVKDYDPDLILMQMFKDDELPVDEMVDELNQWVREKLRAAEAKIKDKRHIDRMPAFRQTAIVLYKAPEETKAGQAMDASENLVAMEDLLQRCANNGMTKYIGMYSRLSFLSKVKEFIK